jgi:hypothetical protein
LLPPASPPADGPGKIEINGWYDKRHRSSTAPSGFAQTGGAAPLCAITVLPSQVV